ncbi:hypothetical protein [uncultured Tenacibaculum sp.]|uniref:hypothetical protein n=1 Tax=uncultured Tenacibaculum sp. TaxID=174713 RepID=UPI0026287185|nr:hypothetical protein [uncultured Tenacibaculum sp.]
MKKIVLIIAVLFSTIAVNAQDYSFVPKGLKLLTMNELMTRQPPTDALPVYYEDGTKTKFSAVMSKIMNQEFTPKMYVNDKGEFQVLVIVKNRKAQASTKSKKVKTSTKNVIDPSLGIEAVPKSLGKEYVNNFNRYTKVIAPNGKAIHIVIQDDVTNEQAVRSRSILEHFLKDYPGSKYGSNKGKIANKMTENNAVLALMNGQDDGSNKIEVDAQPLFKNEMQVEGHSWYVNQDFDHRDASYEEILHFVHDNGIGVDGPNTRPGTAPEYQKEIRTAQKYALSNKLWASGPRFTNIVKEWDEENSLTQEYLASVIDSYYGLWGAWQGSETHGMWGGYIAKTRADIAAKDPKGAAIMDNTFFHPYLTYNARIDSGFKGTFSLSFNESIPYTHHSRYLKDITLLGANNTSVIVNELDNDITGNKGDNIIIFSGNKSEYTISTRAGVINVNDKISKRDGSNTLRNVEKLKFKDQILKL